MQGKVMADRDELERLRADIGAINNDWHVETMRKLAAEAKLAAANAEVTRLTEALADAKENLRAANIAYDRLERDRDAALRKLGELGVWADTFGAALTPHGGAADTYGDGVRACKTQVKTMLSSQPAAPVPVTTCPNCGMVGNACYAHLHVCQPAAPARPKVPGEFASWEIGDRVQLRGPIVDAFAVAPTRAETPELRPGCTRADYYEPTRTESNYSLAELRRIIRDDPGSLTGAELVVRDAMLEMCTSRTEVETVDCESCAIRGIECDNGDHCDSCGRRMDGNVAATADVCHDCWQAAEARVVELEGKRLGAAAEVELAALRERVARATAALTRNHVARALDALRGR